MRWRGRQGDGPDEATDPDGADGTGAAPPHEGPVSWLFRNRATGRMTVAQPPNLSLSVWIGLVVARWIVSPAGTAATWSDVAVAAALGWWAADELVRGVNPFRRILGATVLAYTVVSLVRTLS